MRLLLIDTSARPVAALADAPGADPAAAALLGAHEGASDRRHAEELAPAVESLVAAHGRPDLVVVGTGPGPFTGLRVGLVTARTLARGWGAEVLGVPSLDALARAALDRATGAVVVVATDARRREVYHGRYRAAGENEVEVLAGPAVAAPAAVRDALVAGDVVVGDKADEVTGEQAPGTESAPERPEATAAAALAMARLALSRRAAGTEQPTEPLYLRRPDAAVPAQVRA